MSSTVYYVSARASAGKTYEAAREAHHLALAGEWVLIVQPTLDLINQAASDLRKLNPVFLNTSISLGAGDCNPL